jgi:hypothetical protein
VKVGTVDQTVQKEVQSAARHYDTVPANDTREKPIASLDDGGGALAGGAGRLCRLPDLLDHHSGVADVLLPIAVPEEFSGTSPIQSDFVTQGGVHVGWVGVDLLPQSAEFEIQGKHLLVQSTLGQGEGVARSRGQGAQSGKVRIPRTGSANLRLSLP